MTLTTRIRRFVQWKSASGGDKVNVPTNIANMHMWVIKIKVSQMPFKKKTQEFLSAQMVPHVTGWRKDAAVTSTQEWEYRSPGQVKTEDGRTPDLKRTPGSARTAPGFARIQDLARTPGPARTPDPARTDLASTPEIINFPVTRVGEKSADMTAVVTESQTVLTSTSSHWRIFPSSRGGGSQFWPENKLKEGVRNPNRG